MEASKHLRDGCKHLKETNKYLKHATFIAWSPTYGDRHYGDEIFTIISDTIYSA